MSDLILEDILDEIEAFRDDAQSISAQDCEKRFSELFAKLLVDTRFNMLGAPVTEVLM